MKYHANEYINGQKRYDYAMIEFVSDDGKIATCPARILGFVRYNITLGIPTPQLSGEEELSFNTIQETMAVDNNRYVVVHTASDYVSSCRRPIGLTYVVGPWTHEYRKKK